MKPTERRFLPLREGEGLLAGLSIVGLAAAAILAVSSGGKEFLFYIAVVAVIMSAVAIIHRRVNLSHWSLWALFAWAFLHMAGGMWVVPGTGEVLYNYWLIPGRLKFDQFVHAYGFGVAAWVAWQALCTVVRPAARRSGGVLTAAALAAMGLGALNEVIEFAATKLVEKTNVGDYDNNAWDLVFNMTGAVLAVVLIRLFVGADRFQPSQPA